ncbi:hypothetical protein, partial [Deinococcus sp. ME38]|uniref:hypothetical protein n=1 Tax=Deinococcus sp. ME38 TaxID=3400344 RepID=UPI003B596C41
MDEFEDAMQVVLAAFNTVFSTVQVPWEIRRRVLQRIQRSIRAYAYTDAEDFSVLIEEETGQHDYGDTSRTSCVFIIEVALSVHRWWYRAPTGSALKAWS